MKYEANTKKHTQGRNIKTFRFDWSPPRTNNKQNARAKRQSKHYLICIWQGRGNRLARFNRRRYGNRIGWRGALHNWRETAYFKIRRNYCYAGRHRAFSIRPRGVQVDSNRCVSQIRDQNNALPVWAVRPAKKAVFKLWHARLDILTALPINKRHLEQLPFFGVLYRGYKRWQIYRTITSLRRFDR